MNRVKVTFGQSFVRGSVIILLVLAYSGLGIYFHVVLHTLVVYTHFGYIPIVLAGLWWGRKSIYVALLLAGITFCFRFFDSWEGSLWSDIVRAIFFLLVGTCVGLLSEKVLETQKALSASEEKYRSLIDKSLAGIFVHGYYEIVFVNNRFSKMLGYIPDDLLGKSILQLIYEPDRKQYSELARTQRDQMVSDVRYECRFVCRDLKRIWVDLASSATVFDGEPAVLSTVYDITDRKEAEEKRQELLELSRRQEEQLIHSTRLAELGEMAASIAHEINQPLSAVKNFAKNTIYMIERSMGGTGEIKANLFRITEQVDRASRIINQMRNLTRKSERHFSLLDVNGIVKESVEFMMPHFKLHGIKVMAELTDDLPHIMGDRIRLEQVFLNILSNASQAMEAVVERRLEIRTYMETGNNRPVVVEITDTGEGFTPEQAKKIFTPFYSTKKPGAGTGLGLSISSTIIKEHLGEIEAIGAPGVGSVFKVMLPIPTPEDPVRIEGK